MQWCIIYKSNFNQFRVLFIWPYLRLFILHLKGSGYLVIHSKDTDLSLLSGLRVNIYLSIWEYRQCPALHPEPKPHMWMFRYSHSFLALSFSVATDLQLLFTLCGPVISFCFARIAQRTFFMNHLKVSCQHNAPSPLIFEYNFPLHKDMNHNTTIKIRKLTLTPLPPNPQTHSSSTSYLSGVLYSKRIWLMITCYIELSCLFYHLQCKTVP